MEHFVWNIDPTIFQVGFLQLRYYGLFFVGSFFLGLYFMQWVFACEGKDAKELETLLFYILGFSVVGARLVHCLAYEPHYYLANPLEILLVYKGGLASHGGTLGAILAMWLFAKRYGFNFLWLFSRLLIPVAFVAFAIRMGNFFNSEILGKVTDVPWAIVFERIDDLPRHPTQLYEALSYLLLFLFLLWLYKRSEAQFFTKITPGILFTYIFGMRILLEFTKTRQAHYELDFMLNTGQMLSVPFVLLGVGWLLWAFTSSKTSAT